MTVEPDIPIMPWSFFIDEEKKVVMGLNEDTLDIIEEAGYLEDWKSENLPTETVGHICALMFQVQCRSSNLQEAKGNKKAT